MFSSFFWKKTLVRSGIARFFPSVKRLLGGGEQFLHYLSDRALAFPLADLLDPAWFPDVQAPDAINLRWARRAANCRWAPCAASTIGGPCRPGGSPSFATKSCCGTSSNTKVWPNPADEVLVTHGATGAFATVIDTFSDPGSKVVLFDPTSPIFPLGLKHRRAKIRWVDTWLEEGKTRFDIEGFASAMRGARLLVLSDPCNPTGGVFAPEELEQIAWWARGTTC